MPEVYQHKVKFAEGTKLFALADKCRKQVKLLIKKLNKDQKHKEPINTFEGRKLYIMYTAYKNEMALQQTWFLYCAERKLHPLHSADDLFK